MGAGVAGMHYTGMIAMRMAPGIAYDPALFALSILIAVLASGAALWIAFNLRHNTTRVRRMRLLGAVVMGIAIVGMHYTGMAAATSRWAASAAPSPAVSARNGWRCSSSRSPCR